MDRAEALRLELTLETSNLIFRLGIVSRPIDTFAETKKHVSDDPTDLCMILECCSLI